MAWSASFVRHPGIVFPEGKSIFPPSPQLHIVESTTQEEREKVESILFSLYGFNLWFALEKFDASQIRKNILQILEISAEKISVILDDVRLEEIAQKYAGYKKDVEERSRLSSTDPTTNFHLNIEKEKREK